MIQKLIDFLEYCRRKLQQSRLDIHIVLHQLLIFSKKQITIENIFVDSETNKIAFGADQSRVSNQAPNRAEFFKFLLMTVQGELSENDQAFIESFSTNDDKIIKHAFRLVLMPEGFEAIGYGDHSVVIKPIDNPMFVFKYMQCDNPQDKLIKERLGETDHYPSILTIPHTKFVSSIYCQNGTLTSYVTNNPDLTNSQLIQIFINTCNLVMKIHSRKILIRDIKPDNILIDDNLIPHISDFDVALIDQMESTEYVGTELFMAPEVKKNKEGICPYGVKSEIYSLGCVLSWMFTHIYANFAHFTPLVPPSIQKLALQMLSEKPEDRPTLDVVVRELDSIRKIHYNDDNDFGIISTPFYHQPKADVPKIIRDAAQKRSAYKGHGNNGKDDNKFDFKCERKDSDETKYFLSKQDIEEKIQEEYNTKIYKSAYTSGNNGKDNENKFDFKFKRNDSDVFQYFLSKQDIKEKIQEEYNTKIYKSAYTRRSNNGKDNENKFDFKFKRNDSDVFQYFLSKQDIKEKIQEEYNTKIYKSAYTRRSNNGKDNENKFDFKFKRNDSDVFQYFLRKQDIKEKIQEEKLKVARLRLQLFILKHFFYQDARLILTNN
ncbi:TKL family protein kinase [Trichomonas vaginalis G3]|uniref:TKL family protein kinase n=1 Tax=Trichomonas vaginalis (strain ATCC PRA-98 / G3) TaxID=412133 RepID=A2D952_TRIV3|nr:mitogen-activated protein kinase kinase kinase 20-related family [Trichomonas vaginalis G3]EAY23078.1 TKL family protein kinase [Trichomonas vaginalis G3]KAI5519046.1 mitogen-activated protein kinase kinase kinase 20-related family [Trichomonas vaginalis G3]|eukprot:XP_001584064.1 TKL family protein kinase [Trichomonas vaginalis G3]